MKRDPALISLSRDHHHALVIARRLRDATPETATEIAEAFLVHWNREEKLHFRLEEELLLPAYAVHGDPSHPAVVRMLMDHMLIRRDAERLARAAPRALLHDLGSRLADHVAFEERELFPLIEAALPEADLRALGDRIRDHEAEAGTEAGTHVN
ncbi:MAG: hemerythrin domain-containing protein [Solirubrobacteraceae bacterium]